MEKQLDITCKAALLAAIMALAGLSLFAAAPPSRDEVTITGRLHADTSDLEDAILVVEYPSPQAFVDMVRDPAYQKVHEHRAAALEQGDLVATSQWLAG